MRTSLPAFHALMQTYFDGNYTFCPGSSGAMYGNQNTITNFAFQLPQKHGSRPPPILGEFHEWPFCFNYRAWPDQKQCTDPLLLHRPSDLWPKGMKQSYLRIMRNGTCSSRNYSIQFPKPDIRPNVAAYFNYTLDSHK